MNGEEFYFFRDVSSLFRNDGEEKNKKNETEKPKASQEVAGEQEEVCAKNEIMIRELYMSGKNERVGLSLNVKLWSAHTASRTFSSCCRLLHGKTSRRQLARAHSTIVDRRGVEIQVEQETQRDDFNEGDNLDNKV